MFGASKDMLPIKTFLSTNRHGDRLLRALTQKLRWSAPAYLRKEGATHYPGACSMTGGSIGALWVGETWNIGNLYGKGEVCET